MDEVVRAKEKLSLQEIGVVFNETDEEDDSPDDEINNDILLPVVASDSDPEIVTDSESDNPEDWVSEANHFIPRKLKLKLRHNMQSFIARKREG